MLWKTNTFNKKCLQLFYIKKNKTEKHLIGCSFCSNKTLSLPKNIKTDMIMKKDVINTTKTSGTIAIETKDNFIFWYVAGNYDLKTLINDYFTYNK